MVWACPGIVQLMCPIEWGRSMFFCPLAPSVIKEISIPDDGMVYAQALCNDFPKIALRIMELSDLLAWKYLRGSTGRLFIVCCKHVDPNDDDGNVYL